jgi:hypothetical protein
MAQDVIQLLQLGSFQRADMGIMTAPLTQLQVT